MEVPWMRAGRRVHRCGAGHKHQAGRLDGLAVRRRWLGRLGREDNLTGHRDLPKAVRLCARWAAPSAHALGEAASNARIRDATPIAQTISVQGRRHQHRAHQRPSAAMARMDVRRVPFRMRRGAQRPADQGSRLSERRRREFERDPAGREHRRLPAAKRRDAACRVALLFGDFLSAKRKKVTRRRAHSRPPPSTPAPRYL